MTQIQTEKPPGSGNLRDIPLCEINKPSLFSVKFFDECFEILVVIKVQFVAKTFNWQFSSFTLVWVSVEGGLYTLIHFVISCQASPKTLAKTCLKAAGVKACSA